jgi:hypothetical protein
MPCVTADNSYSGCTVGALLRFCPQSIQQTIEEVISRLRWYFVVPLIGAR